MWILASISRCVQVHIKQFIFNAFAKKLLILLTDVKKKF